MIRELLHRWFDIHDWDYFEIPHLGAHRGRTPYPARSCCICGDLYIKACGVGGDTDWQDAFDPLSHASAVAYEEFTRAYRQYMDDMDTAIAKDALAEQHGTIGWDELKKEMGWEEEA